jgi:GT2 family glycosyltransferase
MLDLSIVVVSYNTKTLTLQCLASVFANPPSCSFEVIVVDNASADGSADAIRASYPLVRVFVSPDNVGFSAANNIGIEASGGDQILLLNSDTIVPQGALDALTAFARTRESLSVVAPKLLNADGSFQRSFFNFPKAVKVLVHTLGLDDVVYAVFRSRLFRMAAECVPTLRFYGETALDEREPREVPYVLFACVLIRRTVFEAVGLLDPNIFFYHEDCEFGYRLTRRGVPVWWIPESQVVHLGGGSSREASVLAYENYYKSLLYVFHKHESSMHAFALRVAITSAFLVRAGLTFVGAYSVLEIPNTYKAPDTRVRAPFGSPAIRAAFYLRLARLGLLSTS